MDGSGGKHELHPHRTRIAVVVVVAALLGLVITRLWVSHGTNEITYNEFIRLVKQGDVVTVVLQRDLATGTLKTAQPIGAGGEEIRRFTTHIPVFGDPSLMPALERRGVKVQVRGSESNTWLVVLFSVLPWLVIFALFYFAGKAYRNTIGGMPRNLRDFLQSPGKNVEIPSITFADVAGQDNAKREVAELVEYLRDPRRYRRLGAEVPRGVLLMGAPGTGKTLLAKALAGEARVPFFSMSGSEFIEVFVGVGASRVRSLFSLAKQHTPCIIFIDELDAVGRTRGTGLGGGHDEREQTLNQILAEMDGFTGREAVIVLAATNRPDVLDPALLRPGRFDRHVTLDLPDRQGRRAVLEVHAAKVPLAPDVDLDAVAAGAPGFSGADLKNLVNEAAMQAAREGRDRVGKQDFDEARDKLILGTARSLVFQAEERRRLAAHEAGHTLAAYYLPHADPPYKVSIIPRGQALGGTQQLPEVERHTLPEEYLRDRLIVMMAGRAAEMQVLGSVSSGADDDIRQATALARAMVARWGMSEEVGPVDLRDSEEHPFLGREIAQPRRFSERSARAVDKAVRDSLLAAQQGAQNLIQTHRPALERLARLLEERETLEREQIIECLGPVAGALKRERGG